MLLQLIRDVPVTSVYKYTADLGPPGINGGEDLFDYQYLQCKGIALIKTMCVVANICNSCIV